MAQTWFVRNQDREDGPYTPSELRALAASGRIGAGTLVRRDGSAEAVPARRLKGLLPEAGAVAAAAPEPAPVPEPAPAPAGDPLRALADSIGIAAGQALFAGDAPSATPAKPTPAAVAAAPAPSRFDAFAGAPIRPATGGAPATPVRSVRPQERFEVRAGDIPLDPPHWRHLWALFAGTIGLGWVGGGLLLAGGHLLPGSIGSVALLALAALPLSVIAFVHWLRPRRVPLGTAIAVGLFTAVGGILLLLTLQWIASAVASGGRVHGRGAIIWAILLLIAVLYTLTDSQSLGLQWIGYVFGVGLLEEMTKLLPLAWLVLHRCDRRMGPHTFLVLGFCSGLGFGIGEALLQYNPWAGDGMSGFDLNAIRWFACVPSHAMWTAMSAAFLWKLGDRLEHAEGWGRVLVVALAAGAMALLHGTYNTLCGINLVVAAIGDAASFAALVFVARWISQDAFDPKGTTEQPATLALRRPVWPAAALGVALVLLLLARTGTHSFSEMVRTQLDPEWRAYLEEVVPASAEAVPVRSRFQLELDDATEHGAIVGRVDNTGPETLHGVIATCCFTDGEEGESFAIGDLEPGGSARLDPDRWPFEPGERLLVRWDGHADAVEFRLP